MRMTKSVSILLLWLAHVALTRAVPPNRVGSPPYRTDGVYTYYTAPDTPSKNLTLKVAHSKPVTLYRLIRRTGIMKVAGAEILLPGTSPPAKREVSAQLDHLEVYDTAADGTVTIGSWDVSALTNPYLPAPAKPGEGTDAQAIQNDREELEPVHWRGDSTFAVRINEAGEADYDGNVSQTRLGSVFVDGASRLFFTPPKGATLFYAKPRNMYEIEGVTHLARNGTVVFEWTRLNDPRYHVEGVDVQTGQPVYSFPGDDELDAYQMLTWVDNHRLLGQFFARKFSEYGVIDLQRRKVTQRTTDQGDDPVAIRDGHIHSYHFPHPDETPRGTPPHG